MERINVTCAIIVVDGSILACKKRKDSDHPFEWEFPGGKVEINETAEQCIVREMKEELAVEVRIEKQLFALNHNYASKKIQLIPFLCKIVNGTPTAIEHEAICWQAIDCFNDLKWSGADEKLFWLNRNEIK